MAALKSQTSTRTIEGSEKRVSQWEVLMRKFSEAHKEQCKNVSLDMPRVARSAKRLPTGSQYEGTWDVLGMSGYGTYIFANGVVYSGWFADGVFEGEGRLRYPCGAEVRGRWRRGALIERTLLFADGLEYSEHDWNYCRMPDRRFTIEYEQGVQPAGQSLRTAEQPPRPVPPGALDAGDGFYDPRTRVVYSPTDLTHIIRSPSVREQRWIAENCRSAECGALGPRPDLFERWAEPRPAREQPPRPAAATRAALAPPSRSRFDSELSALGRLRGWGPPAGSPATATSSAPSGRRAPAASSAPATSSAR